MTVVDLAKKIISIPSFVKESTNEVQLAEYIEEYLMKIPYLTVDRQKVEGNRFNILARSEGAPQLLLAGHLDTVEPKQGGSKDLYSGEIEGDKLYGLGAIDMKGSLAAMLSALQKIDQAKGLAMLFYCDEEYDFKGMQSFIKENRKETFGDLAVFCEPTNLSLWNAHRGIVEVCFAVRGASGHAARPNEGMNAIQAITVILMQLEEWLSEFEEDILGVPSLNIAFIRGGLDQGIIDSFGNRILGKEGNNIPDYAEVTIDIRSTSLRLNEESVKKKIESLAQKENVEVVSFVANHNYGPLITEREKLSLVEKVVKKVIKNVNYIDPSEKGYSDGQMFQQAFNMPVVNFGPTGKNAHAVDEWVSIDSLTKARDVYIELIKEYCF